MGKYGKKIPGSKLVVGNFEKFWDFSGNNYFLFMIFVEIPFWDILGNFGK